jgi:hypothetical protein
VVGGGLAMLGMTDEAHALVARGTKRFPKALIVDTFVTRPDWAPHERARLREAMLKAGFPQAPTN